MTEIPLDFPYNPEEKMLTPQQAADLLGISTITIGRYINLKTNPMPCYRISNRMVRINPQQMMEWVAKRSSMFADHRQSGQLIKESEIK